MSKGKLEQVEVRGNAGQLGLLRSHIHAHAALARSLSPWYDGLMSMMMGEIDSGVVNRMKTIRRSKLFCVCGLGQHITKCE